MNRFIFFVYRVSIKKGEMSEFGLELTKAHRDIFNSLAVKM